MKLTAEDFEAAYAERSRMTVAELHSWGRYAEPCDCSDEFCEGWGMGHQQDDALAENESRDRTKHQTALKESRREPYTRNVLFIGGPMDGRVEPLSSTSRTIYAEWPRQPWWPWQEPVDVTRDRRQPVAYAVQRAEAFGRTIWFACEGVPSDYELFQLLISPIAREAAE
jgi:hypothetical protein